MKKIATIFLLSILFITSCVKEDEIQDFDNPPKEVDGLNVKDYGALCDGVTDDTIAFQKAIDDGSSKKERVVVPAGSHLFLASNIQLRDYTSLLIEEGAIVSTQSRLTGMYVQHIDININGELRQPEYVKTHNDDGSISEDYWLLAGSSTHKYYNPLSTALNYQGHVG